MFYELFLMDELTGDLVPVPVLLKDYDPAGGYPNMNTADVDESNDQFHRRFMLYDSLSGVTSNRDKDDDGTYIPEIVRYANKISLKVAVQDTSNGALLCLGAAGVGL